LAVSVAIGWILVMLMAYAGAFFVVWLVSLIPLGKRWREGGTPFRSVALSPAGAGGSPFAPSAVAERDGQRTGEIAPTGGDVRLGPQKPL
jgi:hypothetical protein